jgi:hypothetical protein
MLAKMQADSRAVRRINILRDEMCCGLVELE